MCPRGRLRIGVVLLLATTCLVAACGPRPAPRPNIILITLDVVRPDRLSLYGYEKPTSPRLEALGRESAVFENAFTLSPSTPPSMAALMTSKLPFWPADTKPWGGAPEIHHGLMRFFAPGEEVKGLPSGLDTLAEQLQAAGYRTGAVVSNPYVKREFHFDQGFDDFEQFTDADWRPYPRGENVVEKGIAWLGRRDERPSFLYLHFMDAHAPYAPPPPWNRFFPAAYVEDGRSDVALSTAFMKTEDPEERKALFEHNSTMFDNCLRYVDTQLGLLFDYLENEGLLDETLLVVHSDHGEEFLDHGNVGHKGTLYDEQLRITLLLHYPPLVRAGRISNLVRQIDVMPTLLDVLQLSPPYPLDGTSFLPLLEGQREKPLDYVVGTIYKSYYVRSRKWKWIDSPNFDSRRLFDLESDPDETENRCSDLPELCSRPDKVLADYVQGRASERMEISSTGQSRPVEGEVSDETVRQLKALGYLD